MSKGNYFETRRGAFDLREKAITAAYTTRAGGSGDNFIEDRVITITDPAASFTLSVSDGTYEGQELLIAFLSDASGVTVTLAADAASSATNTDLAGTATTAGQYWVLMWVNATTGWVSIKESVAT